MIFGPCYPALNPNQIRVIRLVNIHTSSKWSLGGWAIPDRVQFSSCWKDYHYNYYFFFIFKLQEKSFFSWLAVNWFVRAFEVTLIWNCVISPCVHCPWIQALCFQLLNNHKIKVIFLPSVCVNTKPYQSIHFCPLKSQLSRPTLSQPRTPLGLLIGTTLCLCMLMNY